MSMILEALSRAEKERQQDEVSHLDTSRYVTSSTIKEDRFKKWVLVALAANFILITLFAGSYVWKNYLDTGRDINAQAKKDLTVQNIQNESQTDVNQVEARVENQTATIHSEAMNQTLDTAPAIPVVNRSLNSKSEATSLSSLESEFQVSSKKAVTKAKPKVAKAPVKKLPPVQYSSQPLNQSSTKTKPTVSSIAKAVAREKQVSSAKNYSLLTDIPVGQRAQLSQYEVNVHVYDDNPQSRFVLINMVKYKEGDGISGSSASVSTIVPEGVVLNYNNQLVLIERNR